MSFAVQALAAEWLTKQTGLEKKVYPVPDTIDDAIGRGQTGRQGLSIDALTPEQEAYRAAGRWSEGGPLPAKTGFGSDSTRASNSIEKHGMKDRLFI